MTDVLLDARVLERGPGGIGRYVAELARRLPALGVDLCAIVSADENRVEGARSTLRVRSPFLSPLEQLELPARVAAWRVRSPRGVVWTPAYDAPALAPGRTVVTVHDANHLALPQGGVKGLAHAAYYASVVRLACARARAVICPSDFARREVVERIGVDPSKIAVILNGVSAPPTPGDAELERVKAALGLPDRYVLYVGNFKPHKNLRLLLEAAPSFARDVPLVLAGGREAELGGALERARGAGARIVVLPPVADRELMPLLAGAAVFAFPSRYEGFGLPPLEAMGQGVPVVTTTAASLPEVVGDAALLVGPDDATGLAQAISRLLSDRALAGSLVEKGRARVAELSWDRCAAATADVLRRAAG